jgi:hypothetical protein
MTIQTPTASNNRWETRRWLYRFSVLAWLLLLSFVAGPKFFLWFWDVKPAPTSPADFVAEVNRYCVPVVRRMKEYERIHGSLPSDFKQFAPEWQNTQEGQALLNGGTFTRYVELDQMIEYDFTPGHEHWTVKGPFVNGIIPVPPVTLDAQTQPATKP